jgi:hypothetical protein
MARGEDQAANAARGDSRAAASDEDGLAALDGLVSRERLAAEPDEDGLVSHHGFAAP